MENEAIEEMTDKQIDDMAYALQVEGIMPMIIDGMKDENEGIDTVERMLSFILG